MSQEAVDVPVDTGQMDRRQGGVRGAPGEKGWGGEEEMDEEEDGHMYRGLAVSGCSRGR